MFRLNCSLLALLFAVCLGCEEKFAIPEKPLPPPSVDPTRVVAGGEGSKTSLTSPLGKGGKRGVAKDDVAPAKPGIEGYWTGTLNVQDVQTLPVGFRIKKNADGTIKATMDSPDQGQKDVPLDKASFKDGKLVLGLSSAGFSYEGKLNQEETEITGEFKQSGLTIELTLTKGGVRKTAAPPATQQPGIEGYWTGKLKVFDVQEIRVGFRIKQNEDGTFKATMDSPDQGAKDVPFDQASFKANKLVLGLKSAGATYEATLNEAGTELAGHFKQGEMTLELNLKKGEMKVAAAKRPQEPKPPFPYISEDVTYPNKTAELTLAGTLTMPKSPGPHPAVILISGSGASDRDESLMGHKPFLVLSDYLTRRGIAVLRFDDRGTAKSTGDHSTATSADFATDVMAGMDYLKTRPEINHQQIGLAGHSEGGMIAPIVAAQRPDTAFIVLLAGPGVAGDEILYHQVSALLRFRGIPEATIEKHVAIQQRMFAVVKSEDDPEVIGEKIDAIVKEETAKLSEEEKKDLGQLTAITDGQVRMFKGPWFQFFMKHDPREPLRKVKCPVLAVNGEKDYQVYPQQNLPVIEKALKEGGNKDFTVMELPNLNHLFQNSETGAFTEYGQIEETFAPSALKIVGDWIVKRTIEKKS